MEDASYWIARLGMTPLPEGGRFVETYRSGELLTAPALPARFGGPRAVSTAILYLLKGNETSVLHRLRSDEVWHFHLGSSLTVHVLRPDGTLTRHALGPDPDRGGSFQAVIPAGCWFGATVDDPASFALVGCTLAPGFDPADIEIADRAALVAAFPMHRAVIERLTRDGGGTAP